MPNTDAVMSLTAESISTSDRTDPSSMPFAQPRLDLGGAALKLGPDPMAQRRRGLDPLEGGDEHRPQEFGVLGIDLLDPVKVRKDLLHAGGRRVGIGLRRLTYS